MWEEKEFNNVEFIPEPTDNRIVSAADSATVGHQEGWRGEVMAGHLCLFQSYLDQEEQLNVWQMLEYF